MKCVVCEREYTLDANEDIKLITETLAEAKTESASTATATATATAQPNDDNDIKDDEFYLMDAPVLSAYRNDNANDASARIAKYLVEGYALLDEVCTQPCCNGEVPLIQDRQGNKICVQCTNRDTQDETCKDEENYVSLKVKKQTDVTDNFSEDSDELVEEKMQKLVNRKFQTNVPDSTKSSSTSIPNDSDKALKVLTSKFNAAVEAL